MSLKDLKLDFTYSNDEAGIINKFHIPVLDHAIKYDRATGFFSPSILLQIFTVSPKFIKIGGKINLLIGCKITESEYNAIMRGYVVQAEYVFTKHIQNLIDSSESQDKKVLDLLTYLVANGNLTIKVAYTTNPMAMYHEKFGILTDNDNNQVMFMGSANETYQGLNVGANMESIAVFTSHRDAERIKDFSDRFHDLWHNKNPYILISDIPNISRDLLIKNAPSELPTDLLIPNKKQLVKKAWEKNQEEKPIHSDTEKGPHIASYKGQPFTLRPHQQHAITAWENAEYSGILKLATGSGKTLTAIYSAVQLYKKNGIKCVIVVVPLKNLASQWAEEMMPFGFNPIQCHSDAKDWDKTLTKKINQIRSGGEKIISIIAVKKTFESDRFQRLLQKLDTQKMMFIGDECHGHNTLPFAQKMPKAQFKMGLSATPEHYRDSQKNQLLFATYSHPNNIHTAPIAEYGLADALNDKVLTPYKYYPIIVNLIDEEFIEYNGYKATIASFISRGGNFAEPDSAVTSAMGAMSRIIANASEKLLKLKNILSETGKSKHCLFYSGAGQHIAEAEGLKQINHITKLLYDLGWHTCKFTAEESLPERNEILKKFALEEYDALVAIRCLDEGVDIPACRTAFITASSNDPREFVQRRGRILRQYEGKEYAEIYDFVVNNPGESKSTEAENGQITPTLIRKELSRVYEFAHLSINEEHAQSVMQDICDYEGISWGEECILDFATDYGTSYSEE